MPERDAIIVGQGLAGTTLAWCLLEAGLSVLVTDREEDITSSKIAAGLITPITGQRLALSWQVETFLPAARIFYALLEQRTGEKFFHEREAVRIFYRDDERERWEQKRLDPAFQRHLSDPQPSPLLDPELVEVDAGGFAMRTAQLDVAKFLAVSRRYFQELGCHEVGEFDWTAALPTARWIISCEGYAAVRNPYFDWIPFKAAKGEILTVRFDRPLSPRSVHRGIWMAPTADPAVYRVGSTYDWEHLDQCPTAKARAELEAKLRSFIKLPFVVENHEAAVRPIIQESKALLGLHPVHEQLGYFNGLGSKGSLHAPWFAACFRDHLVHGSPLPLGCDLRKNF